MRKKHAKPGARFFYPGNLGNGAEVRLPPEAAHHAVRVLRLSVGEPIVVFNGQGGEYEARITRIEKDVVTAKMGAHLDRDSETPLELMLAQGLSSGDRMDLTIQKAVELGVSAIQPLATERSIVKLTEDRARRRAEHWQNLVISACEQCGRNRIPPVFPLARFDEWLGHLPRHSRDNERRVLLAPAADSTLRSLTPGVGRIILLAGPEGGLSQTEADAARQWDFHPVRLGPRVLRTETAALAALASIQTLWGDF